MRHVVFIINPKSGVERRKEIGDAVEACLDKSLYTYELLNTEFARHGTSLAAEAARNGAYAVIAVGGDGSVNDIVRGLLGTNTLLGIIPKGSGNGMARSMNIPLQVTDAIRLINSGKVLPVDVGFANGSPFLSNAGVAFDALIARKFSKSKTRGFWNYSWLVTKHMWLYRSWNWNITVDGKSMTEKAFMVIAANGKQFGYNFQIAPMADYTDGLLDVIIVRRFPKLLAMAIVVRAMTGKIAGSPWVTHLRGKHITVSHPKLRLMQTDGDAHECTNSIDFTILSAAIKILVP